LLAAWTIRKALSCLFAAISFCGLQPFSQGKFTQPFSQAFEAKDILGGLDGDNPARDVIEAQDREIAERSGQPMLAIKTVRRST
jgi:hypothetical protein